MQEFSMIIIWFIGGWWVLFSILVIISSLFQKGRVRWIRFTAGVCLVIGGIGFFGSGLSSTGQLNWLPSTFEWPVGFAKGVVTTKSGLYVVPHYPVSRVQIYDPNWVFIRGWHVNTDGIDFRVSVAEDDYIEVRTARGNHLYVFDVHGKLLSEQSYSEDIPLSLMSVNGYSYMVPTPPWLWVFSGPFFSGCVIAIGMGMLIVMEMKRKNMKLFKKPGTIG
jgi:hypothetical protein